MELYNNILLGHNNIRYKFLLNGISNIIDGKIYKEIYNKIMGMDYCLGKFEYSDKLTDNIFNILTSEYNLEYNIKYTKDLNNNIIIIDKNNIDNFNNYIDGINNRIKSIPKIYKKDNLILNRIEEKINKYNKKYPYELCKDTFYKDDIDSTISNIFKDIYSHILYKDRNSSKYILQGIEEFINDIRDIVNISEILLITDDIINKIINIKDYDILNDDKISDLKLLGKTIILKEIMDSNKYDDILEDLVNFIFYKRS